MEAGFLNFHDEEHFSLQNSDFEAENSLFNVFGSCDDALTGSWIIPDADVADFGSDSTPSEQKEDFQKTFQDWQQHISTLQARDNVENIDISEEMPDIFGLPISLPKNKEKLQKSNNKVHCYKVAKRNGLVIKLKKEVDADQPIVYSKIVDKGSYIGVNKTEKDPLLEDVKPNIEELNKSLAKYHSTNESKFSPHLAEQKNRRSVQSQGSLSFVSTDGNKVNIKVEKQEFSKEVVVEDTAEIEAKPSFIKIDHDVLFDNQPITVSFLEARDATTLLEQFEISDPPQNESSKSPQAEPQKSISPVKELSNSHKSIKDALPKEIIERIKESSQRKKGISLVPAERLPAHGNDHMKDAGASRTKTLRCELRCSGESAQLDHDYCTQQQQQAQHEKAQGTVGGRTTEDGRDWDKRYDSKKDSGLESGDVSDSSERSSERGSKTSSQPPLVVVRPGESLLKSRLKTGEEAFTQPSSPQTEDIVHIKTEPSDLLEEPKKKKLNLEEYRNRRGKIVKPRSPIKYKLVGWNSPLEESTKKANSAANKTMINAEVQVQIEEVKTSEQSCKENRCSNNRENRSNERYRRRSSSSSSYESRRSRTSKRRARSKKRRHQGRSQRSRWSYSRSRSRSRSYSPSSSNSLSSSSSRSRSRSRSYHRRHSSRRKSSSHSHSKWRRSSGSSGPVVVRRSEDWSPVEKMRQVEERRVIYVGQIDEGTSKTQLRERFGTFGNIVDISLHFRERGDNYGFVTFAFKEDAYLAVEHGNDPPHHPLYDICFGGRRAFCKQRYSDLDGSSPQQGYSPHQQNSRSNDSFDNLLREAQKKLLKRSSQHV